MSLITQGVLPTEAELKSYQIIATVAANNPHWKKVGGSGTNDQVVATILSVMLLARELGISPIQSISGGIHNINGKFEISARLMNQLIRKHGHQLKVKISTDEVCSIWTKRKDTGEEHIVEYHIEEAARANLIKDGSAWKKCPKDMLFARAISRMARQVYADCIAGCYVEGELQEAIQNRIVQAVDVPSIEEMNQEKKNEVIEAEEEMILHLPEDYDSNRVEEYISFNSNITKRSISNVKARAANNMTKFLEAFRSWESEVYPQVEEVMEIGA
jgi:hypothetical protein